MLSSLKLSIMKVNSAQTDICQNFDCKEANNGVLREIHNILVITAQFCWFKNKKLYIINLQSEKTLKQEDDKQSSENEYSKVSKIIENKLEKY